MYNTHWDFHISKSQAIHCPKSIANEKKGLYTIHSTSDIELVDLQLTGHALGIWIGGCRLFCKGGSKGGYRGGSIRLKSELGIFYSSQS